MQPIDHFRPTADVPAELIALDEEAVRREIVNRFHYLYYHSARQTWTNTRWLGVPLLKCPLDLWIYQEILFELRPDVIVECGTFQGGGAFYLATVCDLLGRGRVYSIDVTQQPGCPVHPRIEYLSGSSTSEAVLAMVRQRIQPGERALIILDSDHSYAHVSAELERYAPLVPPGGYLIVEDTNINGHPVFPTFGPGPMEAVHDFLASHPEFASDAEREKLFLSFNPRGYLKRSGDWPSAAGQQQADAGQSAVAALQRTIDDLQARLTTLREQVEVAQRARIGK